MSLTIHSKNKYFDSTVQRAKDKRQKFHFCRLPFAVNVILNFSISLDAFKMCRLRPVSLFLENCEKNVKQDWESGYDRDGAAAGSAGVGRRTNRENLFARLPTPSLLAARGMAARTSR